VSSGEWRYASSGEERAVKDERAILRSSSSMS